MAAAGQAVGQAAAEITDGAAVALAARAAGGSAAEERAAAPKRGPTASRRAVADPGTASVAGRCRHRAWRGGAATQPVGGVRKFVLFDGAWP